VPQAELVCCRVGDDEDLTAAQLGRAVLKLLCASRQLVCLHGMVNRPPTCRGGGVHALGSCHMVWLVPQLEAETARANE
jgi:hypothetical protein